jgi:hypothetical protein
VEIVPARWVAVQCTLFEKSPRKNWLVSLHQDLSIPVRERVSSSALSETGALRVIPGSHRFGRLDGTRAAALREEYGAVMPAGSRGGVLAMQPPTLPLGLAWG